MTPLGMTDFYKVNHAPMYPDGTTKIYSNMTPRKSRMKGVSEIVVFGPQFFVKDIIIDRWNRDFFQRPKQEAIAEFKRLMDYTLGVDTVSMEHFEKLHDLGYMPLKIKVLPEGSLCPIGVPMLTITSTVDHAYWLVNYLETVMSAQLWGPMTSATIAYQYRKLLEKYALETGGDIAFVDWQAHDFSARGLYGVEAVAMSGMGHLLSFFGTDTIPAIIYHEKYYNANIEKELVGSSVPATEHSVMSMNIEDVFSILEDGGMQELIDEYYSFV
jgi:nicotinamide phosphoribosyltransferase